MTFLVGPDNVVHAKACRHTPENGILYATKVKTHPELRALLLTPDVKDKHSAPGILVPCSDCIEGD